MLSAKLWGILGDFNKNSWRGNFLSTGNGNHKISDEKFGQIRPWTAELAALEGLEKSPYKLIIGASFLQDKGIFTEGPGKANTIAYALNCLTSALGLWFIVCRTKQCLDFAVTLHLFHFIVCWIYNGHIPNTLSWWILNLVGMTLMTVLGEFLCMRTEMKAIPLSMGPKVDL